MDTRDARVKKRGGERRGGEKRREGKGEKLKSGLPSWNGSLSIIHIERYIRFLFPLPSPLAAAAAALSRLYGEPIYGCIGLAVVKVNLCFAHGYPFGFISV